MTKKSNQNELANFGPVRLADVGAIVLDGCLLLGFDHLFGRKWVLLLGAGRVQLLWRESLNVFQ